MERKLIELYRQLHDDGAFFFNRKFTTSSEDKKSAVIQVGDDFAVFIDTERIETMSEETELVAHECGHVATGTTHSVCSPIDLVAKHEHKANKWAVHEVLPEQELRQAVKEGYTEVWELAERLSRTEDFIRLALDIYRAEGVDLSAEMSEELYPGAWAVGL